MYNLLYRTIRISHYNFNYWYNLFFLIKSNTINYYYCFFDGVYIVTMKKKIPWLKQILEFYLKL